MSKLTQWLDHRMEVVGLNRWKDLSEYSGVPHETIREMNTCGSLLVLSRSDRRSLADSRHYRRLRPAHPPDQDRQERAD